MSPAMMRPFARKEDDTGGDGSSRSAAGRGALVVLLALLLLAHCSRGSRAPDASSATTAKQAAARADMPSNPEVLLTMPWDPLNLTETVARCGNGYPEACVAAANIHQEKFELSELRYHPRSGHGPRDPVQPQVQLDLIHRATALYRARCIAGRNEACEVYVGFAYHDRPISDAPALMGLGDIYLWPSSPDRAAEKTDEGFLRNRRAREAPEASVSDCALKGEHCGELLQRNVDDAAARVAFRSAAGLPALRRCLASSGDCETAMAIATGYPVPSAAIYDAREWLASRMLPFTRPDSQWGDLGRDLPPDADPNVTATLAHRALLREETLMARARCLDGNAEACAQAIRTFEDSIRACSFGSEQGCSAATNIGSHLGKPVAAWPTGVTNGPLDATVGIEMAERAKLTECVHGGLHACAQLRPRVIRYGESVERTADGDRRAMVFAPLFPPGTPELRQLANVEAGLCGDLGVDNCANWASRGEGLCDDYCMDRGAAAVVERSSDSGRTAVAKRALEDRGVEVAAGVESDGTVRASGERRRRRRLHGVDAEPDVRDRPGRKLGLAQAAPVVAERSRGRDVGAGRADGRVRLWRG
jgi:hypothetical protein